MTTPGTASPSVDPAEWVERAARECAERPFLRHPGSRPLSYAQLCERSGRFAAALLSLGVTPGDRVAVRVDKSADAVLLYVACLRLGVVYVPINVASPLNEVEYLLGDSSPSVAVVRPQEEAELTTLARDAGVGHVETLAADGEGSLARLARTSTAQWRSAPSGATSPAALVYTSGTTGRPKGAILTRANLASNAEVLAEAWRFTGQDIVIHALPLCHVHGLFVAINTALAARAGILLLDRFEAPEVLRHLAGGTVFMGVPTHYTRLLRESGLGREATAAMRLFVSGSAPLLAETHQEFLGRTGHSILERYGMTETLMSTSNPYDGPRVPGSVGPALAGVSVRVADPESGAVQSEPDSIGALEVTGPNVFAGYWRDPQKTRAAFSADGWFRTGDVGRIDRNGYLYIVGRARDLVISGGYNVYPKEVEQQLDRVPGVAESAVFGVPHPDYGEGVTAAVVLKPGVMLAEGQIIESVRSQLASYKVPKRVLVIAELPRNAMGKVQKNVLRTEYAALYSEPAPR